MSSVGAAPRAAIPTSSARAEASRRNGARSRGPKTPEGKARSSRNALKHGMRAEKYVLLPDEDAVEFKSLEAALTEELAPDGALQTLLVGRIARAAWRLERAERLEVELFEERSYGDSGPGLALIRDGNGTRSFETLLRYRGAALAELWRALRTLKALQTEAGARAAAGAQAPARALAPVRLATVGSASPAASSKRRAARETDPNEPERRGSACAPSRPSDRMNPSTAPRGEQPEPCPSPARGAAAAVVGPARCAQPIEPETCRHPRAAAPPSASSASPPARTWREAGACS